METTLVTGANRGIGLPLTRALLASVLRAERPDRKGILVFPLTPTTDTANCHEGPSEDYGNDEHTTVAAFLPWRGS